MKRFWAILLCLAVLGGCAGRGESIPGSVLFKRLDEVEEFFINEGDAGNGQDIVITDSKEKSQLVDMLCKHSYIKEEKFIHDSVGCGLSISWRQPGDGLMLEVEPSGDRILYQDWFYRVADGEMDLPAVYRLIYRDAAFYQGGELFDLGAAVRISVRNAWENRSFEIEAGEDVEKIRNMFSGAAYMDKGIIDDGYGQYILEWYDENGSLLCESGVHGDYGVVYEGAIYLIVSEDGIDTRYLYDLEKEILHLPDPTPIPTAAPNLLASASPAPTNSP